MTAGYGKVDDEYMRLVLHWCMSVLIPTPVAMLAHMPLCQSLDKRVASARPLPLVVRATACRAEGRRWLFKAATNSERDLLTAPFDGCSHHHPM